MTCHPRLGVVSDKQTVQWTFAASSKQRRHTAGVIGIIPPVFCNVTARLRPDRQHPEDQPDHR